MQWTIERDGEYTARFTPSEDGLYKFTVDGMTKDGKDVGRGTHNLRVAPSDDVSPPRDGPVLAIRCLVLRSVAEVRRPRLPAILAEVVRTSAWPTRSYQTWPNDFISTCR